MSATDNLIPTSISRSTAREGASRLIAETLAEWRNALMTWPLPHSKMRVYNDGRTENLGRVDPDVHQRVDNHAELRAQVLVRERFGDLDAARTVLAELIEVPTNHPDCAACAGCPSWGRGLPQPTDTWTLAPYSPLL